ncbi:DNA-directed RNA polymerase III subunit RPC6 [Trichinella nativa]|uniref:DNA-directed RNA polymerase III subunit RPC6 n=1 Tax=Trichinella nativa TaxID=6335 RepID=A0A0V1LA57_9BILA|nr:DNA-directed RNA polymerase III subunit RPC6 [Trichinella nativa]
MFLDYRYLQELYFLPATNNLAIINVVMYANANIKSEIKSERTDKLLQSESSERFTFKEKILEVIKRYPNGCPDCVLRSEISAKEVKDMANSINELLAEHRIDLLKSGNEIYYKFVSESAVVDSMMPLDPLEKLLYQLIVDAENMGIWIGDLKTKSNIPHRRLMKVIRSMENRKMIKTYHSMAHSRKKVCVLYGLQPHPSIVGGSFFTDEMFDTEFLASISECCLKFLKSKADSASHFPTFINRMNKRNATVEEVWQFLCNSKILNVNLSQIEVERVLENLVHDSQIEKKFENARPVYFLAKPLERNQGILHSPCLSCEIALDCVKGGTVSPNSCQYFSDWLLDE